MIGIWAMIDRQSMIPPRPDVANRREELLALINNGKEEEARVWNDGNIAPNERLMLDEGFLFLYSPPEQVKLNPSLADAWLSLGNCIWKKGDLPSAKNCFSLSLSKGPNKKILCQLSMLERINDAEMFLQLKNTLLIYFTMKHTGTENKAASIEESITHAREAVQLDIRDGNSWCYNVPRATMCIGNIAPNERLMLDEGFLFLYSPPEQVKLNPSLADAWLSLGNCIWKKGDLPSAKNCFSLSLSKGPNKKILCQLSMLERSMAQGKHTIPWLYFFFLNLIFYFAVNDAEMCCTENKAASIEESITHAREAVQLDIRDGNSWYNLGNACLTSFFVTGTWDHAKLQQALKAYQNAEKDALMHSNPDLYFNCASANKYLENYERALHGFEAASLRDPGLNAESEAQKIVSLLEKIESSMKVMTRAKRLASLVSSLDEISLKSSHRKVSINTLKEGLNKAVAVIGKILLFIKHEDIAPFFTVDHRLAGNDNKSLDAKLNKPPRMG
ncbi:hypothetical protein ZIOFF_011647 [Zingiber officinale]|uniref:Uncharacterized protein n=1 Tax=Zingiber officinale TaxID=94328 RepID=A0A8J5HJI4_ZINOF|nr:hypothetical protein ZIOFF_011647 [Zingiber officinale]